MKRWIGDNEPGGPEGMMTGSVGMGTAYIEFITVEI